ncbi:hypothetical protein H0A36_27615 [Endozoicomonas sp. SM1973]|uniref:Uncharacterized protein n=1 Tax=Spartinivicinus marinus TaxID=2994442 RepID=A0A853IIC6_9GAMM|nr:hypothetical protein [Spartinivicinus marinus]NYZ69784.1 hypothetical protein [Spartinivicinus marinus]
MKHWINQLLCIFIYAGSAIVIVRSFIYIFMRFSEVAAQTGSVYVVLAMAYLIVLCAWCVLLLGVHNYVRKAKGLFYSLGIIFLVLSLAYVGLFQLSLLPVFEPLELVFVVYDMSIIAAVISLLSLILGQKNLKSILGSKGSIH